MPSGDRTPAKRYRKIGNPKIAEDKADLIKAKDELEHKVQERTVELALTIQALQNEIEDHRLTEAALRRSQEQLRDLSRKILDAQENERRMVAQEIHDSIGGSLAAIKFALEEKIDSMGQNPSPGVISLRKLSPRSMKPSKNPAEFRPICARPCSMTWDCWQP